MAEVTLDLLFRTLERMREDMRAGREEVNAFRIETRHRFELTDRRLTDIESRMAGLEAKGTAHDLRLAEIHMDHEKRLDTLEGGRAS